MVRTAPQNERQSLAEEDLSVDSARQEEKKKNEVTDFMRSRNMEEDMTEDRHLWRLGMDGRLLAVQNLIIKIVIIIILTGKPTGKRPLGRPRRRWEDNITMDLEEIGINAGIGLIRLRIEITGEPLRMRH